MASDVQGKHEGPMWKHRVSVMVRPDEVISKVPVAKSSWGTWPSGKPKNPWRPKGGWYKVRKLWLKLNPPTHEGYYQCALCPEMVHVSEVTLDHILTRSQAPQLVYKLSNLQPAHWLCNTARGSMSMEAWNKQRYK